MTNLVFNGVTIANGANNVTYSISSSSTNDTGEYHCDATIDGRHRHSITYTLFGEPFCIIKIVFLIYYYTL